MQLFQNQNWPGQSQIHELFFRGRVVFWGGGLNPMGFIIKNEWLFALNEIIVRFTRRLGVNFSINLLRNVKAPVLFCNFSNLRPEQMVILL